MGRSAHVEYSSMMRRLHEIQAKKQRQARQKRVQQQASPEQTQTSSDGSVNVDSARDAVPDPMSAGAVPKVPGTQLERERLDSTVSDTKTSDTRKTVGPALDELFLSSDIDERLYVPGNPARPAIEEVESEDDLRQLLLNKRAQQQNIATAQISYNPEQRETYNDTDDLRVMLTKQNYERQLEETAAAAAAALADLNPSCQYKQDRPQNVQSSNDSGSDSSSSVSSSDSDSDDDDKPADQSNGEKEMIQQDSMPLANAASPGVRETHDNVHSPSDKSSNSDSSSCSESSVDDEHEESLHDNDHYSVDDYKDHNEHNSTHETNEVNEHDSATPTIDLDAVSFFVDTTPSNNEVNEEPQVLLPGDEADPEQSSAPVLLKVENTNQNTGLSLQYSSEECQTQNYYSIENDVSTITSSDSNVMDTSDASIDSRQEVPAAFPAGKTSEKSHKSVLNSDHESPQHIDLETKCDNESPVILKNNLVSSDNVILSQSDSEIRVGDSDAENCSKKVEINTAEAIDVVNVTDSRESSTFNDTETAVPTSEGLGGGMSSCDNKMTDYKNVRNSLNASTTSSSLSLSEPPALLPSSSSSQSVSFRPPNSHVVTLASSPSSFHATNSVSISSGTDSPSSSLRSGPSQKLTGNISNQVPAKNPPEPSESTAASKHINAEKRRLNLNTLANYERLYNKRK